MAVEISEGAEDSAPSRTPLLLPPPSSTDTVGVAKPATPAFKWLGFVAAVWVQAISGNNYTFSNYSDALKSVMDLTQLELNYLSVAKDIGKAFGLLPGLASDRVSPGVLLLIGSIEGFIGYGVQWLVVSEKISPLPYWMMCIFLCMGGNSTTWLNTAVLVTCIRNFRKNRGPVSGILKGYVGLSTAIFTDLCTALFSDSASSFLIMLALVPLLVCLTAIPFLREVPPSSSPEEERQESRYFGIFNVLAIIIAVYLLVYDVTGSHSTVISIVFVVGLLILLASPLSVPIYLFVQKLIRTDSKPDFDVERSEAEDEVRDLLLPKPSVEAAEGAEDKMTDLLLSKPTSDTDKVVEDGVTNGLLLVSTAEVAEAGERRTPVIGDEHTIYEALRTLDFWILFVSFLCGVGTGLAVMNNMGQIGLALGYTDVSIFVSLISIFGFFGRIGSGTISEYFIKKAATPRPLWNAASQILMAFGYIIMALALTGSLYMGSIVVGFCYGVRLAVTVPVASELFGLKYYGLVYNILILNLPLGSFLFSGLLAGYLYDAQATETAGGGNTCTGAHCYRLVFIIMAIACIVGFGLDILLGLRTKSVYAKISASKNANKPIANGS